MQPLELPPAARLRFGVANNIGRCRMPRAKAFDHDQALDRAMRLFWRKGYDATSIDDLVRAMGINRASMYGAFGDKRRLFLAAMDRYVAKVSASRLADLRRPGSAKAAIRRYFQRRVEFSAGDGRRLGCLLTNAAIEMAPRDPTIEARLQRAFGAVDAAFGRVIRRGQMRGEIDQRKSARAIARFLVGATQGIRVLARARPDCRSLHDIVNIALTALD
jgi:TetR/AcrR family transcriptional repressor of nem operon